MKSILIVLLSLTAAVTHANVVTVKCAQADDKVISRADSVAAVTYKIDTATYAGRLGCAVRKQGVLCQSIRMDLSKFNKGELIHRCGRSQYAQHGFTFTLRQEDEFYNEVTLIVVQNCQTGKLGAISASISNEISGEDPTREFVATTSCEVVK